MRWLVVVVLVGTLGSGCGADPAAVRDDYCAAVEDHQQRLSEIMAEDSPTTLLRALPVFRDLAEQAPRDIAEDWDRVVAALGGLEGALDAAGVEPEDYDTSDPPAGVTRSDRRAIARAADQVARPEVAAALERVQQQARDVCKTPLYR